MNWILFVSPDWSLEGLLQLPPPADTKSLHRIQQRCDSSPNKGDKGEVM